MEEKDEEKDERESKRRKKKDGKINGEKNKFTMTKFVEKARDILEERKSKKGNFWERYIADKIRNNVQDFIKGDWGEFFKTIGEWLKGEKKGIMELKIKKENNREILEKEETIEYIRNCIKEKFEAEETEKREKDYRMKLFYEMNNKFEFFYNDIQKNQIMGYIDKAMEKMSKDKAPAYDGIAPQMMKFSGFREKMKYKIIDILERGEEMINKDEEHLLTGRLVMIPKEEGYIKFDRLRPIMVNTIINRIIENTIKEMMDQWKYEKIFISNEQLGFKKKKIYPITDSSHE